MGEQAQAALDRFLGGGGTGNTANGRINSAPTIDSRTSLPQSTYEEMEDTIARATKALGDYNKFSTVKEDEAFDKYLTSGRVSNTEDKRDLTRERGVNDVSHKKTLRYSRMVDALNNKFYTKPRWAGVRQSSTVGGAGAGIHEAPDRQDIYKMDGIETAETRAQKRNEAYEQDVRREEIERQQLAKGMPLEMARLNQLAIKARAGKISNQEMAEYNALWTAMLNKKYILPFQLQMSEALSLFLQRLTGIQIPMEKVNMVLSQATGDPKDMFAQIMSGTALGTGNIAPGTMATYGPWLQTVYNNWDDAEALTELNAALTESMGKTGSNAVKDAMEENR